MRIRVPGDLVFIRPEPLPSVSETGLHLVHEREFVPMVGEIIAIGEGPRSRNGTLLPHHVAVGNRVIFAPETYQEVQFQQETLLVMSEDDIAGIIEEEGAA